MGNFFSSYLPTIIFEENWQHLIYSIINRIKGKEYWKERIVGLLGLGMYFFGNLIEILSSPTHTTTDPPSIWITGGLLSAFVVALSLSRWKRYIPFIFRVFLVFVNFNMVFAYAQHAKDPAADQSLYLFFSYAIFIVSSQMLNSRRELIAMTIYQLLLYALAAYATRQYQPLLLYPLHLLALGFVVAGNYVIGTLRLHYTQISGSTSIHFKTLSENSRDMQVIIDAENRFLYLNPAVRSLAGYALDKLAGKDFFHLVAPQDEAWVRAALQALKLNPAEKVNREYRIVRADGSFLWVESIFSVLELDMEQGSGLVFVEARDVMQRKGMEEEMQQQLQIEELLLKYSTRFIHLERAEILAGINHALEDFGKMMEADAALIYRMQGTLEDEFSSTGQWFREQPDAAVVPFNFLVKIHHDLIVFLQQWRGEKFSWGDFVEADSLKKLHILTDRDTADKKFYLIPLQTGNVVNGFIIFAFNQNTVYKRSSFFGLIGGMIANAYARLRAESRLNEIQLTNEYILRALPDWLYMIHADGTFTGVNDYSTLDPYLVDYDLLGKDFSKVLPENAVAQFGEALKAIRVTGENVSFDYEDTTLRKGKYFKVILAPFKEEEYLVIIHDITDKKEAQLQLLSKAEKLEQSNKELEEFAYVVSHDMRQPIRTIISYLSLLKKKYDGQLDETANEFIRFSVEGAHKMSDLIRDILQYSRVEQQIEMMANVSLNSVVKKVLDNLKEVIQRDQATVVVAGLPVVYGNETMLTELFQNLVENGIKYNRNAAKEVMIAVAEQKDFWEFTVSDNGIGFDEKYAQLIFKIFKRLHGESEFQGTGIGLSICHKVVTKHGGKIWATSTPGEGSHFCFTLPKRTMPPSAG